MTSGTQMLSSPGKVSLAEEPGEEPSMIRIELADNHALARQGLASMFAKVDDIDIVATAHDGHAAVNLAAQTQPDVVLMEVSMPGIDGIEATRRICEARGETRVVMLTSNADSWTVLASIDAGAVGYLLKDADANTLVEGVRSAAGGEYPLDPRAVGVLVKSRGDHDGPCLTARESEVLKLVGGGLANKQIARRLGIREKTVKSHLTRVFGQLGVTDRTQAALWAHAHGIAT